MLIVIYSCTLKHLYIITYSVCGSLLTLFYTSACEVSALLYTSTKPENKPLSGKISLKGHYSEYSGIPPYNHPVYATTSLLQPYSFNPNLKKTESFYYFEDPINETTSLLQPGFYGPTEVALMRGSTVSLYPHSLLPPKLFLLSSWSFFSVLTLIIIWYFTTKLLLSCR